MTFLQPWLLIALPLIALPIIIHLVNQWRYQTKAWAAMMFLFQAQSMHRGMAKLRQWLILAMRTLAVAGLIFAVSRPLASGVIGRFAGGSVDTTIVILDRSPSMTVRAADSNETKLQTAIRQLRESLEYRRSEHWLLIDSVSSGKVSEFGSLDDLIRSVIDEANDATANWLPMLRTALRHLQNNTPSEADIWLCSDMRVGDWQADDGPWADLRNDFKKLPTERASSRLLIPIRPPTTPRYELPKPGSLIKTITKNFS